MTLVRTRTYAAILFIWAVAASTASAVSYQPGLFHRQDVAGTFSRGETVYLFHSGTADVRAAVGRGDILTVYRTDSTCRVTEAGKIRAVVYEGETYLKAEVVEGEIRRDDIARKGGISFIVISAGLCDR